MALLRFDSRPLTISLNRQHLALQANIEAELVKVRARR